jgi:hypothetical protein
MGSMKKFSEAYIYFDWNMNFMAAHRLLMRMKTFMRWDARYCLYSGPELRPFNGYTSAGGKLISKLQHYPLSCTGNYCHESDF